ncbi:hypothetical protein [Rhizobium mesoamericanum]|uniref:hypothetical protein n=1 Tax=Rhizobium mesoamericanum TaxID=1079800 RepID=UPI0012DCE371|nr:hypothetical protein [Rhizobium mesoamericanum]
MPSDRFRVTRYADDTFAVVDGETGLPAEVGVTSVQRLQIEAEELAKRLNSHVDVGAMVNADPDLLPPT